MKINAVSNAINYFSKKNIQNKANNVSFGAIYVDESVNLGEASESKFKNRFLKKDALLLNKIAQLYPNQDCFIKKGHDGYPALEFRERPPEVQPFNASIFKQYDISVNPDDPDYPCEPLLLYDDDEMNRLIGLPSFVSLNPSLAYTVQAGYELHKKLIAKKQQIMEVVGKTGGIEFGEKTLVQRAHEGIKGMEEAVKRYLLESAYLALSNRASSRQINESNYPKVQSRLDSERTLDLTTSLARQKELKQKIDSDLRQPENVDIEQKDICEYAMQLYPNYNDNVQANKMFLEYMTSNGIIIA